MCERWGYSQWGTDAEDSGYCEVRDSYESRGSTTRLEEWRWALSGRMIIGNRNHYYVRKGGLMADFEEAIKRAIELAVCELQTVWLGQGK